MSYIILVLSGLVIGLIVALPIGPVNLICIRRTLALGPVNGFVSGLGAALGDGVFAIITGFRIHSRAQWIHGFSATLELTGGVLLVIFGVSTYFSDPLHGRGVEQVASRQVGAPSLVRAFASTFALTITNPATLFGFASAVRRRWADFPARKRVSPMPRSSCSALSADRRCGGSR